ncbi:MAG: helicase RepA family protein [Treponema sp.]|nr:helicase RepA family protein [Treponema sp.]
MTRQELTKAIEEKTTVVALTDCLLGFSETELKTLPLGPLKKHAKKYGFDITTGELGELLKESLELEKKRPHFEKIGNAVIESILWVVSGVIETGSLCMIFGDSGTFKSFLAICIAACIATGRDFYGHTVKKGAIFYIAAEGSAGIIRRFRAWSQENNVNITEAPIYRYTGAVNLLDQANILTAALEDAIDNETEPPVLAVIDTWSRALTGDDSDTSAAADGLAKLDAIRAKFPGLAIVIIHHTGHREKSRARGASLIHAAVDSEFRVEKTSDCNIIFTNTKSKESELLPPMAFKARGVKLIADNGGYLLNESGEIETSAVLDTIDDYIAPVGDTGLGKNQERILETLRSIEGHNMTAGDLLETLKKRFAMKKDAFDKAILSMEERGLLYSETGFICLGKPKKDLS